MKLIITLIVGYLVCVYSPLQEILGVFFLKGTVTYDYYSIIIGVAIVTILYSVFLKMSCKKPMNNVYSKSFISLICISILGNIISYSALYMLVGNIKYVSYINIIYIVITCSMLIVGGLWIYQTIYIERMWKFTPMFILYAASIIISERIYFFTETLNYEVAYYQIKGLNLFLICGIIALIISWIAFVALDKKYFANLKYQ